MKKAQNGHCWNRAEAAGSCFGSFSVSLQKVHRQQKDPCLHRDARPPGSRSKRRVVQSAALCEVRIRERDRTFESWMEKCLTFALTDFLAGRSGMRERCLFVSPVIRMREAAGAALLLLHLFAFPSAAFFLPPDPRILFFHFRTRTTTAAASSSFSSSAVCFAALRKIPLCVCHLLKDHPSHPNFCFAAAPGTL